MNIEFTHKDVDLMNGPIDEPIKEHIFEEEEEEFKDLGFSRHNTFNPKPFKDFEENNLFNLNADKDEMNLDNPE